MAEQNNPLLLTDELMRKFITDGFLILKTDFSKEFHEKLNDQLLNVYEEEGNPGNNLLPRVTELQRVFEHPVITGALTSVLGPDYMLHAHRHGHYNASSVPGEWHKDSYWGYNRMRNHHPWWAMIMYFPQDTPAELGPTGILPGTQNYDSRVFDADELDQEVLASGEVGTFALIHYDIWHRATSNTLGNPRFMLKFEFMRTKAPTKPSWNNVESTWRLPEATSLLFAQHDVMWEETWNWLSGKLGSMAKTATHTSKIVENKLSMLENNYEPIALNAAYELASCGKYGVQSLLTALQHENGNVSRLAAYGLSIAGKDAIPGLILALDDSRTATVIRAIFALSEHRHMAAEAVPALNRLLDHYSVLIRRSVAEALGMIGHPVKEAVDGLIHCLQDEDSQVRFMAGLSICRIGAPAESAVPQLRIALQDKNRYVRAHAAEALRYIGTEQANKALITFLFDSRWCPTTTPANPFYP
ncbi:HEAT repeat domain-containing protein [Alkalihalobacillus hemicellulosilyticus]|uniref:PBS lyase HEAT domain protein repeat-containing protein n=1 Tax=Halalkalibacter hemicellulosilyticusJCM 9152 TaxID=1236971 RepID=W4QBJ4_9BACI|nr:HEAT repeat domain-containing protein [Halalkalibacter hemicellulosilyticus]GAE29390.1 PBS lyase HEAT domain protein repeat-containing protein [Halalkalibacter hemicellulosilyticusJCM 9152]